MKKIIYIFFLCFLASSIKVKSQEKADSLYDYLITINTDYGKIRLVLFDDTPEHKKNFLTLAQNGIYNHLSFHRIINNFMIQTGDTRTRNVPIDYDPSVIQSTIKAEIMPHYDHSRGFIGAARRGENVNPEMRSNGTQFYIIQNVRGAHHLDGKYTIFGKVMSGMDVVDKIAAIETNEKDQPLKAIRMTVTVDKVLKEELTRFYNYPVH